MKVRRGFVSNSSSSSFIVVVKNGQKCDAKYIAEKVMGVGPDGIFYDLAIQSANFLIQGDKCKSFKDACRDDSYLIDSTEGDKIEEYFDKHRGCCIIIGRACDDDTLNQAVLCDLDIHYEDDVVIIDKDGGY